MNYKIYSTLLLVFIFSQCTFTEESISSDRFSEYAIEEPDFNDGNCYAKCMMPDLYKTNYEAYPVYTGNINSEDVETKTIDLELQPASTKWVKKKADKNCVSPDPNDCLVWCLVQVPAVTESVTILADTTQSENYQMTSFPTKELSQEGGFTEWRQVVCVKDITPQLVNQIQSYLKEEEYYSGTSTSKLDRDTKTALSNFQKENNLPLGNLDFETLDFMGIDVEL